jgi:L-aminopeptidase/D-esterase-like protein
VGKLLHPDVRVPGGLGTASLALPGGGTVGALAAVNAVGDVVAADGSVLAGPGTRDALLRDGLRLPPPVAGTSTTLVVVATDLTLDKAQANRLATVAHDGLARAVEPVHTSYDGDTVFAVGTGRLPVDAAGVVVLETAAAEVVARAVRAAVRG